MVGKKESMWFRGLKFAEKVGAEEAEYLLNTHEFADRFDDFERGVRDYLIYYENTLKKIK